LERTHSKRRASCRPIGVLRRTPRSKQPASQRISKDNSDTITVFNGEMCNHREVRAELKVLAAARHVRVALWNRSKKRAASVRARL
jgi:hypothetical protein